MSNQGTVAGVGIIVAAFTNEYAADGALNALKEAKKQNEIQFDDGAVIRQDAAGKVHYHETGDMKTDQGMGLGALVGAAVGALGGPFGIVLGMSAGGAVGAAAAHGDAGIDDANLEQMGTALKPGTSALVAITSHEFLEAVQHNITKEEIQATVKELGEGVSAHLEAGRDVAYGLTITGDGVAVTALAADDKTAQVMGIAAT